ncbi:MAG: sigma-54 dependent transcriptional regulator [Rikenellaceae bacterium]
MELSSVKQRFGIIGHSELLDRALDVALKVAATDLTVLVGGESGVGKEIFPQVIHAFSARKHGKYIAVNCGAIPEGTIDSELFGHEKGAFTGAVESRRGYFEEADGGTIFLDEVGELPLATQVRLLRVLQSGEFIRVGSTKVQKCNVRVVAATNVRLEESIASGRFREDLYYRLSTVPIAVPPLRERREDIFLLFRKFCADVATKYQMPSISLDVEARAMLENYYWRGNIRQLKNVAEQISAVEPLRVITPDVLARYLGDVGGANGSIVMGGAGRQSHDDSFSSERELLYKVLFDMRSEIAELRRMMSQMMGAMGVANIPNMPTMSNMPNAQVDMVPQLPPPTAAFAPLQAEIVEGELMNVTNDAAFQTESMEVKEITTKADMQREMITRALRKHNGRRKEAAAELFLSERTLYRRIKELGIEEV